MGGVDSLVPVACCVHGRRPLLRLKQVLRRRNTGQQLEVGPVCLGQQKQGTDSLCYTPQLCLPLVCSRVNKKVEEFLLVQGNLHPNNATHFSHRPHPSRIHFPPPLTCLEIFFGVHHSQRPGLSPNPCHMVGIELALLLRELIR